MADQVKVTWSQRTFDETFKRYMQFTSRSLTLAINTKAYFIARKSVWFTDKADKGKIRNQLIQTVQIPSKRKPGTFRNKRVLTRARQYDAPLAAVIINARRGRAGKEGLYGKAMRAAVRDMIAARVRSVAYIKSGWLPAIRALAKLADRRNQPSIDTEAKQIGNVKGAGYPANAGQGWKPTARILNDAWTKHGDKDALTKVGGKGHQKAFNDETASMAQYIRDKMQPAAHEFNSKQK